MMPARASFGARDGSDRERRCREFLDALDRGELAEVEELDLSNCGLERLPESVGALTRLKFLNAGGNALRALPASFGALKSLRVAFFLGNAFEEVPEVLGTLPNLFMLSFKANRVARVPENSLAPSLGWLILSDNAIETLPESLGRCVPMRKLMLAGNKLKSLPESARNLHNLELLRLADNAFDVVPEWLYELPKLTWLAVAANPCTDVHADRAKDKANHAQLPVVEWSELGVADDAQALGSGASGSVYAGEWNGSRVAVKVYNNVAKTSDGRPEDEMTASVLAATIASPGTVKTVGRFKRNDAKGLIMEFLNPDVWTMLGNPPNFDTVTRDVYNADVRFTVREIWAVARDITSALRELHSLGIAHGDVYAHNILYIRESTPGHTPKAKLGDFGATFFYDVASPTASTIQLNEARALGAVLEELCDRHDGAAADALIADIRSIATALLGHRLGRFSFAQAQSRLQNLADRVVES